MVENLFGKNAKTDNLKTFNGDSSTLEKTIEKPLMPIMPWKTLTIPSPSKNDHRYALALQLLVGSFIINWNTGLCSSPPLFVCKEEMLLSFSQNFPLLNKEEMFWPFLSVSICLARSQSINNLELFKHNHHHCCELR